MPFTRLAHVARFARPLLLLVALASIGMLGVGLYLQLVLDMLPCPLCIVQRYAFLKIALLCLVALALPDKGMRVIAGLGSLAGLGGAGIAIRHLWVKAHPTVSCGIDPLETLLNKLPFANWYPPLFAADGLCTTEYAPILGLSIPQWALVWFLVFTTVTALVAWRGGRAA